MLDFARENERSELTGEMIGDTLDDALADEGDAEAEDKIVNQVCLAIPLFRALILISAEYLSTLVNAPLPFQHSIDAEYK